MRDDTGTIRIFEKLDMISSDITGLKVDVAELKVRTENLGGVLTKDSAITLIAYAIGEHESRCGQQNEKRKTAKAKLIIAGVGVIITVASFFAGGLL
jgi:hypothetical protein